MKNGPYELVVAPIDYPGFKYRGRYVYEHQLVWWRQTGEVVMGMFIIHHKNHIKRDNSFENLEKKLRADHTTEHNLEHPAPVTKSICFCCKKEFALTVREHRQRARQTKSGNLFCSKSCQIKVQQQDLSFRNKKGRHSLHGTASRYASGCRCAPCRTGHATKIRLYRLKKKLARGSGSNTDCKSVEHGS